MLSTHTATYPCFVTSTPQLSGPSAGNNYSITLAIGAVAVILLIINILTVVVSVTVCLKKKRTETSIDEGGNAVYDYPAVGQNDICFIKSMRNEAYAVSTQETVTI